MTFSLVYRRPDGWWEAGRGWKTVEDARADGENHDWRRSSWAIVRSDALVDIEGDMRLPSDVEPSEIEPERGEAVLEHLNPGETVRAGDGLPDGYFILEGADGICVEARTVREGQRKLAAVREEER